jgi:radical SAM protein with 4Fe4S-binding SPASM domain
MPFDDFLKAILPLKNIYKPNTITVAITGGEPILRKDLPDCGRKLRENGFFWGIVTNGYDYTPDVHRRLLGAGMGSLTLSLDGLETTHNWLRDNNKSFARAVKALELITASPGLNYDVVTCVNQKNIDELEQLRDFLIDRNVMAWRLFTISPIGRAANNDVLQLTPEQLKRLMDFIVQSRSGANRGGKRMAVTFSCEAWLGDYELIARDSYFFCRAGILIASVLIDGSISACPNIDRAFVQGNIYRDNFADVWNNRFEIMRDRRWTKTGICQNCKDYKDCLGGAMHLWNGKKDGIMTCINQKVESVR